MFFNLVASQHDKIQILKIWESNSFLFVRYMPSNSVSLKLLYHVTIMVLLMFSCTHQLAYPGSNIVSVDSWSGLSVIYFTWNAEITCLTFRLEGGPVVHNDSETMECTQWRYMLWLLGTWSEPWCLASPHHHGISSSKSIFLWNYIQFPGRLEFYQWKCKVIF